MKRLIIGGKYLSKFRASDATEGFKELSEEVDSVVQSAVGLVTVDLREIAEDSEEYPAAMKEYKAAAAKHPYLIAKGKGVSETKVSFEDRLKVAQDKTENAKNEKVKT